MGRIYKKLTRKVDPATGEATERESHKYYIEFLDEHRKKRRLAVSPDKSVTTRKLAQVERDVDRKRNGEFDPYETHRLRPVADQLKDYGQFLRSKGTSEGHASQIIKRGTDVMTNCGFVWLSEIRAAAVQNYIHELRKKGLSVQTCNFYLQAAKQFVRWLVQDRRLLDSPLRGLSAMNVKVDRRHDRRALSADEFDRLLSAALQGKRVEGISGSERRMLYLFASSTGLRRAELSSLTLRSLDLDAEYPSVIVEAAYSKNGRDDKLPLHPMVVEELRDWLGQQKRTPSQPLFHLKSAGGELRDTANMMRRDLAAARQSWIAETNDPDEVQRRNESDFLRYKNSAGLFADFHANRHTFISNLARAGVHPKMAQTLARHSTINLTMNTYTHVNMEEKSRAVGHLYALGTTPPAQEASGQNQPSPITAEVSDLGPSGVLNGVTNGAAPGSEEVPAGTLVGSPSVTASTEEEGHNPIQESHLGVHWLRVASPGIMPERSQKEVHPAGLEPATFGSVVAFLPNAASLKTLYSQRIYDYGLIRNYAQV